jgi:hypothetical protein
VGEVLEGRGIETLDGVVLLGEVLVVIGVESRMPLHQHLVAGDEAEASDGEERGIGIVTMITGGYRRLERIVTLRLPGVVDVEGVVWIVGIVETAEVGGEGRGTRDLVVRRLAETPDTTERTVDPDMHTGRGALCGIFIRDRLYSDIRPKSSSASLLATDRQWGSSSTLVVLS